MKSKINHQIHLFSLPCDVNVMINYHVDGLIDQLHSSYRAEKEFREIASLASTDDQQDFSKIADEYGQLNKMTQQLLKQLEEMFL